MVQPGKKTDLVDLNTFKDFSTLLKGCKKGAVVSTVASPQEGLRYDSFLRGVINWELCPRGAQPSPNVSTMLAEGPTDTAPVAAVRTLLGLCRCLGPNEAT